MVTLATALANAAQRWTVVLRIEGVGPGLTASEHTAAGLDGRTRFCAYVPEFAASEPASLWQPLLAELPSLLSERADPLGGSQELGGLGFTLVDVGDYLTALLRTERAPTTALTSATTTSTTGLVVGSTAGLAADTAIYVGAEAMRVASVDSGTALTVVRGYLGTVAAPHGVGDRVFLSTPVLETRRVTAQLVPIDADNATEAYELGVFAIDEVTWDEDANTWTFACSSQLRQLNRAIPYRPQSVEISPRWVNGVGQQTELAEGVENGSASFALRDLSNSPSANAIADMREWQGTEADPSHLFYLAFGDEMISVQGTGGYIGPDVKVLRRDVTGTGDQTTLKLGSIGRRVFVARTGTGADAGSFRYSPGPTPATSRSTGTWTRTANWIDLLLILMTSSHDPSDGLELVNYSASGTDRERTNWSSLPSGYGLGMPIGDIDVASFLAVRDRTLEYEFPNFTFGQKVEAFGKLIEREFLRPMGAFLSVNNGVARIILPKIPLLNSASLTIGAADILTREVGPGLVSPRWRVSRGSGSLVSDLVYQLGPGEPVPFPLSDGNYAELFGHRGVFVAGGPVVEIPVPGARKTDAPLFARRGIARLYRSHRPRMLAQGDLTLAPTQTWPVGDTAAVTVPELVNMRDTTRGWDGVQCQLLERTVVLEGARDDEAGPGTPGPATGAYLAVKAQAYGPEARVGRVAPAAVCSGGGGFVWSFSANVYTSSDALGGLPTQDVAAFSIGDVVTLVDAAGVVNVSAGTETVVDVLPGSNELEFTGDFNGELGVGSIVVFTTSGTASAEQRARYAFIASKTDQVIPGSGDLANVYGEG